MRSWFMWLVVPALAVVLLVPASAMAAPGDIFYEDGFEGYTLGTHPAPWGEMRGNDDDVVTDEWAESGIQSFVSVSTDNLNVKRPFVSLEDVGALPLPDYFCYEAAVHVDAAQASTAIVGFFLSDPRYPGEVAAENAVAFRGDGKVMWYGPVSRQLGTWSAGVEQTFTVRVEISFARGRASVWINDVQAASCVAAWPKVIPAESVYGEEVPLERWGFGLAHNFSGDSARVFIDDVTLKECDTVPCEQGCVKIRPRTINLKSKGRVITGFIELPEGLDAHDIDVSTVYIACGESDKVFALERPTAVRDADGDGLPERMVKFPRQQVHTILDVGNPVIVTIGGELNDGTCFVGDTEVRVIMPGKNNQNQHGNQNQNNNQQHYGL